MKKAAIIVIGDEILLGRVTDTNSGAISRALDRIGAKVININTVGDTSAEIRQAVERGFDIADIVLTTGGLGPTKDDVTKSTLAAIFGGAMVRDDSITHNIKSIFAGRGLKLNALTLDQAIVPSSAHIIQNRFGTAPIMVFEGNGKLLVSMPGVPFETEGMLPEVIDYISYKLDIGRGYKHTTWVVTGISESALAQHLDNYESQLPEGYKLAYLPSSPVITLRLDGSASDDRYDEQVALLEKTLNDIAEVTVLGHGEKTLARIVIETLCQKGLSLSTAESCTGGNIAHLITSVSGSSEVFNGSVVSYANSAKIDVLEVKAEAIEKHGAVSQPVVIQMAEGVSKVLRTDCAIATSGIAGPSGGTPEKPVGTVWIAVKTPRGVFSQCHRFPGDRGRVIERASATALIILLKNL